METGLSLSEHGEDYWEPELTSERFSAFLECQNSRCKEMVIVAGITEHNLSYGYDVFGKTTSDLVRYLIPKFAFPPPPMFVRHEEFPDEINSALAAAFGLFWSDLNACANRFRTCVEVYLAIQGHVGSDNLHTKILRFQKNNAEMAEMLLSIKWIGNEGSHALFGNFKRDDLLHAAEVLEYILGETFLDKKSKLIEKAKEINARYKKDKL